MVEGQKNNGPGCGWFIAIPVIVVVLVLLVVTISAEKSGSSVSTPRTNNTATVACIMAEGFVKDRLRSPSTASFPRPGGPDCSATRSGTTWTVLSFVDAQNGFGATVRNDYALQMSTDPVGDNWQLVEIAIVPR